MKIVEQKVEVLYPRTVEEGVEELRKIEIAGRNCWRSEGKMTDESYKPFIANLIKRGHGSPLEFGNIMFRITTGRDVMAELTRHRVASFCLSGDTIIGYEDTNKGLTIRDLYGKKKPYQRLSKLRSVNEQDKEIVMNNVVNVFFNGIQETYTIETSDGYFIRATAAHEFLTPNGWTQLRNLKPGDTLYTNGIEAYKQKEWLNDKYNNENLSQKEIAELCQVSHHTIRAWIRKFGLQKPAGSWCIGKSPVNKGRTKYDYPPMMKTSLSQLKRWRDPELVGHVGKNKPPIDEVYGLKRTNSNGYTKVSKYYQRKYICSVCGEHSDKTEIHHIDRNPKNFTPENLIELCETCHKRAHKGAAVKAVKPSVIKSIEYYGKEDVYDIEMKEPYHNYVANGFVVHNCIESQRYVNEAREEGGIRFIKPDFYLDPDAVHTDDVETTRLVEASIAWRGSMERAEAYYNYLIDCGTRNQDARKVLPNSTACTIVMSCNLRELLHIYDLRSSSAAYPEMRSLMRLLKPEVDKVLPGFLPEREDI